MTTQYTRGKRTPLVVYLRPESLKALQNLSQKTDTSMSSHVRKAIDELLARHGITVPAPKAR